MFTVGFSLRDEETGESYEVVKDVDADAYKLFNSAEGENYGVVFYLNKVFVCHLFHLPDFIEMKEFDMDAYLNNSDDGNDDRTVH